MNNKKYNLRLTQEEMDNIVYALVLLKVDEAPSNAIGNALVLRIDLYLLGLILLGVA